MYLEEKHITQAEIKHTINLNLKLIQSKIIINFNEQDLAEKIVHSIRIFKLFIKKIINTGHKIPTYKNRLTEKKDEKRITGE